MHHSNSGKTQFFFNSLARHFRLYWEPMKDVWSSVFFFFFFLFWSSLGLFWNASVIITSCSASSNASRWALCSARYVNSSICIKFYTTEGAFGHQGRQTSGSILNKQECVCSVLLSSQCSSGKNTFLLESAGSVCALRSAFSKKISLGLLPAANAACWKIAEGFYVL